MTHRTDTGTAPDKEERRLTYAQMIDFIEAETGVRFSRKTLINDVSAGKVEGIVRIGHLAYGTQAIALRWYRSKIRPHPSAAVMAKREAHAGSNEPPARS